MGLPIIVQSVVYKITKEGLMFLVLKRNQKRGGFWSIVNGTLEVDETVLQCRIRELGEETGIKRVLAWSEEINRFSFKYNDCTMVVIAYAAKVTPAQRVLINNEHDEYRWMNLGEAVNILKFNDDKNSIHACNQLITKLA